MPTREAAILYEYPFNERVRTMLRLEDLFDKVAYFRAQSHPYCHHTALLTLFEILEMTSRADLKGDLLQELERHRQSLLALRNNPHVSESALAAVLTDIEATQQALNATPGKAGQQLRENEWLTSIRSRASIPGGTCEFDLPSYHAWLMRDAETRSADLDGWIGPLQQFYDALRIVLRLLRESAHRTPQVAAQGAFQQMFQGRTFALLQVRVAAELNAVPEISANKYALWIRFAGADRDLKPRPLDRDVPFELALCAF
ncbi:MAG TPA: cell division protein ZapD [Burkholderiaceae bacterium]|nr:cell division protein ZapD [Burkholderiaceae bacterium]